MLFHSSFSSPFLADRIGGDVPYEQVGVIAEELGDKRLSAICSKNSLNIPASELGNNELLLNNPTHANQRPR